MSKSSKLVSVAAYLAVVMALFFSLTGCSQNTDSRAVAASTPILFGPPGSRFWTTFENAKALSGKPVTYCTTVHSDHEIGTAQDSSQNRYMSAEKPGDTVELRLVAKADDKYETAAGMQVLFHQYPVDDAPWIAKSYSAFFMRDQNGAITQVGQIDSEYRQIAGNQSLMTKGMSEGERWTGDVNGNIYRLYEDEKMVMVGEYDRRWVTPTGQDQRLILPLMMSRNNSENAPWIGELGGVVFVEDPAAGKETR